MLKGSKDASKGCSLFVYQGIVPHIKLHLKICLVSQVTRQLRNDGWPSLSIHGDKSQQERDWVLAVRALWRAVFYLLLQRL